MNLSNDKNLEKGLDVNNSDNTTSGNNSSVANTNTKVNNDTIEEVNFENIFTNEDNIKGFDVTKEDLDSVAKINEIYNADIEII